VADTLRARGVWIAAAAVLVLIAGAWALEHVSDPGRISGSDNAVAASYSIAVVRDGKTLSTFTVPQLEALGMQRAKMQGKWEQGPSVRSVLEAAGVDEFSSLRFVGMAIRDEGELTLAREEVGAGVLLDIALRGTAKVCGPNIPQADRVRDLIRIEVER